MVCLIELLKIEIFIFGLLNRAVKKRVFIFGLFDCAIKNGDFIFGVPKSHSYIQQFTRVSNLLTLMFVNSF